MAISNKELRNIGINQEFSEFNNGGGLEGNSNRNETQENNFGVSYKLGDKFTLGRKFGNKDEEVFITEIMPSGLFFKVDKSSKIFSIKTLHSRGSTNTSGEYLVPIKKTYANGGGVSSDQRRKGYVHGYKFDNPNDRETFTNYLEREDIDYYTRNGVVATKMAISNKELRNIGINQEFSEFGNGGGVKDVIVYDNGGESLDRYTIFTPDGSVYGMSESGGGFNQYLGDNTEVEKGSHLGKRLKSVPKSIEKAVMQRMNDSYAKGGMTEHGLRVGDSIIEDFGDESIGVRSSNGDFHSVNLDKGKRFDNGGGVYNRSWHQDHNRYNKREKYEIPVSSRKKGHGGTIEERMRMRRGM